MPGVRKDAAGVFAESFAAMIESSTVPILLLLTTTVLFKPLMQFECIPHTLASLRLRAWILHFETYLDACPCALVAVLAVTSRMMSFVARRKSQLS